MDNIGDIDSIDMSTWLRMSDQQRAEVVSAYIGQGRRIRPASTPKDRPRPSRRTLAEAKELEPGYPAGQPTYAWESDQLNGLAEHHERLAAQFASTRTPELDVNRLDDAQRAAVARCSTREQYEAVANAIRSGKPLPTIEPTSIDGARSSQ